MSMIGIAKGKGKARVGETGRMRVDRVFGDGERRCPICGGPLPAHETWPGARYRVCPKAACKAELRLKRIPGMRYVEHLQVKCGAVRCANYVPEGMYATNPGLLTCSGTCADALVPGVRSTIRLKCRCGCGTELKRKLAKQWKEGYFASPECCARYRIERYISDNCGLFTNVAKEYLDGDARSRYAGNTAHGVRNARVSIVPFFRFLVDQGVTSLEAVTPKTITAYIAWSVKTKPRDMNNQIPFVSVFFKWAIAMGYRESGNPVVSSIHLTKQRRRLPQPYSEDDIEFMWHLLNTRGNSRLRFAAAIGEEAGLRIREVCNLRISDLDIEASHCNVRTPNKGKRSRIALFSEKTKFFFGEWMKERWNEVQHDHVLHTVTGKPCSPETLREDFKRVLCKTSVGQQFNEIGFDEWHYHRLRHTMASLLASAGADAATTMASGGWTTFKAMENYAQVTAEAHRAEYQQAMQRAEEQKSADTVTRVLSPTELLARRAKAALKHELARHSERCV